MLVKTKWLICFLFVYMNIDVVGGRLFRGRGGDGPGTSTVPWAAGPLRGDLGAIPL